MCIWDLHFFFCRGQQFSAASNGKPAGTSHQEWFGESCVDLFGQKEVAQRVQTWRQ
jgi:hypothetical protein